MTSITTLPMSRKPYAPESSEQKAFVEWLKLHDLPFFAIPNGGSRHSAEAGRMKAEGIQPGVPDLFIARPRWPYHGLFVEMKSTGPGARVSPAQRQWLRVLNEQGYYAIVCHGWENAVAQTIDYLDPNVELKPSIWRS